MGAGKNTTIPKRIRAYAVDKLLGRGGMGEVFLAKHDELDRPVAIKRFAPPADMKDPKAARERFLREGQALARLRHQGVIGVHDLFEQGAELYMVLEYVDGYDVDGLLRRGALSTEIACSIGMGLAEALDHAHFHGVIHRDVKVSNVMVSRSGQVKLMDFGIARGEDLALVTKTGVLVGTPKYIAPEALIGGEQTKQGDIYGIGVVLYHCLSGKRLYHQCSPKDLYQAVVNGKYVPLSKIASQVPRALRRIVQRCLERDPKRRYRSADEVARELDLFLADQGIWGSRAERLAAFVQSVDKLPEGHTLDSIEISGFEAEAPPGTRRGLRLVLWIVISLLLVGLGAFAFWGMLRLGWLDQVLEAIGFVAVGA